MGLVSPLSNKKVVATTGAIVAHPGNTVRELINVKDHSSNRNPITPITELMAELIRRTDFPQVAKMIPHANSHILDGIEKNANRIEVDPIPLVDNNKQ